MRVWGCVLAAWLMVPLSSHGQPGPEISPVAPDAGASCPDQPYSVIDLLDPDKGVESKSEDSRVVAALAANPACQYERYLIGSLHRVGPELPNNPLPKDVAKARELIEGYGLAGRPVAFADLAEMALAEGDGRSAMRWAQVYLYLMVKNPSAEQESFDRRGYNADLLERATSAWRRTRLPRSQIAVDLRDYLAKSDALLANVRARGVAKWGVTRSDTGEMLDLRQKDPAQEYRTDKRYEAGYGIFLLEIQPSGKVSRIVPESYAPNYQTGAALRDLLRSMEFHPTGGRRPAIVRIPVMYGYDDSRAPSIKR